MASSTQEEAATAGGPQQRPHEAAAAAGSRGRRPAGAAPVLLQQPRLELAAVGPFAAARRAAEEEQVADGTGPETSGALLQLQLLLTLVLGSTIILLARRVAPGLAPPLEGGGDEMWQQDVRLPLHCGLGVLLYVVCQPQARAQVRLAVTKFDGTWLCM